MIGKEFRQLRFEGLTAIVGTIVVCFALSSFGQDATVNFTGITNSDSFAGGYVDPYAGTVIINNSQLNPNGLLICDDFYDHINNGETWTANAIQASSLNSGNVGNTLFGNQIGLNGYAALASLMTDLFVPQASNQTLQAYQQNQADLSAAIWYITSGNNQVDQNNGNDYVLNGNDLDSAAAGYVSSALATYRPLGASGNANDGNALLSDLWILAPYPDTPANGGLDTPPQEMWAWDSSTAPRFTPPAPPVTPVSEGGGNLSYLLLAGCAIGGGVLFRSRSRFAKLRKG
jgi:hypothetical protein